MAPENLNLEMYVTQPSAPTLRDQLAMSVISQPPGEFEFAPPFPAPIEREFEEPFPNARSYTRDDEDAFNNDLMAWRKRKADHDSQNRKIYNAWLVASLAARLAAWRYYVADAMLSAREHAQR